MTRLDGDQPLLSSASGVWPAGHRAALCFTINVAGPGDEEAAFGAALESDYERTGTDRLLRLLADTGVEATFAWSRAAVAADDGLIARVRAAGHELAAWLGEHDRSEERLVAGLRGLRIELERLVGIEVVGVNATGLGNQESIQRAAHEIGIRWILAPPSADLPTIVQPDGAFSPVVRVPASRWYDDRHVFGDRGLVARHAFETWRDDLDTIREEGGLMVLRLHPSVSGRPGPSRAIAQLLDHAIETGDLWITRADHLALWWLEQHGPS